MHVQCLRASFEEGCHSTSKGIFSFSKHEHKTNKQTKTGEGVRDWVGGGGGWKGCKFLDRCHLM